MDSVRDMAAGNYGIRALYAPIQRGKGCFYVPDFRDGAIQRPWK